MTLDEAILELNDLVAEGGIYNAAKRYQAAKLGIEALKYIKEWRIPPHGRATILLPGETAE